MTNRKHRRAVGNTAASEAADWLYGIHSVAAALANPGRRHRRLLVTDAGAAALAERGAPASVAAETVSRHELDLLLPAGAVHQGVALLSEPPPPPDIEDLAAPPGDAVVVVLDQVTDPRNVGAVMRSAAAFGARGLVVQKRHAPEESGALAKAASGALEILPVCRVTNLARALEILKRHGFWCLGLDADGPALLSEVDTSGRVALVLGAEGSGLRRLTHAHCDIVARLPIARRIDSLNVSSAAAVALYEVMRGR